MNTTLEAMKEKELLDVDPSKAARPDEDEDDQGDDGELDDGDEDGPGPSGRKVSKEPHAAPEGIFDDKDPEEMTLQQLIDSQPDHWKKGTGGDGKIYLNDDGEKVKLNKGYPCKIGEDGRRLFKTSLRPKSTYSPEEWPKLSQPDWNTILKAEKKKLEKKEADEKSKRKLEEVKKKALKKEKKLDKKDKGRPKSKGDEEGGEDEKDDLHSKLKKCDAGVGEVKPKVTVPTSCTSAYLDLYDIVDDDVVHGKRHATAGGTELMPAHAPMLPLTFRMMRNVPRNGTNGRRSRRVVVRKHHGVVRYGTLCQGRYRDSLRQRDDQEWQVCQYQ